MNPCLERWIEEREANDPDTLRLYLRLPRELAPYAWDFESAIGRLLEEMYGVASSTSGVSTTCGASELSYRVGERTVVLYMEAPGGYPL